jgi:phage regulator Rha-like protein
MTKQKPAHKIDLNGLRATVWKNTGKKGDYFTVQLSRSFRDKKGNWKETASFSAGQLDAVRALVDQAEAFIKKQEPAPAE